MSNSIRICQVSSDYRAGGGERIARVLAAGAAGAGHDSILLTLRGENPDGPSLGCGNVYGPLAAVRLYRWLRDWADARPDALHIVHCHMTPCQLHGAMVAGAMRLMRKFTLNHRQRTGNLIFVTTEHNPWNRRRKYPLFRWLDRWMYGRYAAIFAISTGVETSLREWIGRHLPAGSRVIWNGVALPCDRVTDRYAQSDPATLRFFSIGRYTEQKNYPKILAALEQLGRPVRYEIFGGDEAGRAPACGPCRADRGFLKPC